MALRPFLASLLLLSTSACIVQTTDDDDDTGGGPATSSASSTTETGSSSSAETGAMDTSGTSGSADGSSGVVSGTGEFVPDCSMCNENVDPDPLCHSEFNPVSGECECDEGYIFESSDSDDFTCVRQEGMPGDCGDDPNASENAEGDCVCNEGYEWCSDDPNDLTCCEV